MRLSRRCVVIAVSLALAAVACACSAAADPTAAARPPDRATQTRARESVAERRALAHIRAHTRTPAAVRAQMLDAVRDVQLSTADPVGLTAFAPAPPSAPDPLEAPPDGAPSLAVSARFACNLRDRSPPDAATLAKDESEKRRFERWESSVAFVLVPTIVSGLRASPVSPPVLENSGFPWSLSYDRLAPPRIRVNPKLFARQCAKYGLDRDDAAYTEALYGNIAHELGHWLAHVGRPESIREFVAAYPGVVKDDRGDYLPAVVIHELFADYYAGRILARHWQDRGPLLNFFRNVGGAEDGTHPPPARRVAAVELGYKDERQPDFTDAERTALRSVLGTSP